MAATFYCHRVSGLVRLGFDWGFTTLSRVGKLRIVKRAQTSDSKCVNNRTPRNSTTKSNAWECRGKQCSAEPASPICYMTKGLLYVDCPLGLQFALLFVSSSHAQILCVLVFLQVVRNFTKEHLPILLSFCSPPTRPQYLFLSLFPSFAASVLPT